MANKIEQASFGTSNVNKSSRYANSTVVYYGPNKLLTYTTYKRTVIPPSSKDRYTVVSPGSEYRPDIMSQNAYGTPDYWWKILEANGLKDIYEFKAGLNIRIPSNIY